MKRLFIIRHGKSAWDYESAGDIDRPLKIRGMEDGLRMAKRIKEMRLIPELIVSSNANRALHTASIFQRVLELPKDHFLLEPDLYLADVDEILNVIFGLEEEFSSIMLFGHNPGFTEVTNYLSRLNLMNMPTTGMAILEFDTDKWTEIARDKLKYEYFDFPRKS